MSQDKADDTARKPEDAPAPDAEAAHEDKPAKSKDAPGKGLNYVFKIAPADPKNAFDFEDVADK